MNNNIVSLGRNKVSEADFVTHVDPVCKMLVKPETAAADFDYQGEKHCFRAAECLNKFRQNPEEFRRESRQSNNVRTDRPDGRRSAAFPLSDLGIGNADRRQPVFADSDSKFKI